jgi:hypothetical protein
MPPAALPWFSILAERWPGVADDRFLAQVLEKRIQPTPEVSLDEIMTYVSAEYGEEEEKLRGLRETV